MHYRYFTHLFSKIICLSNLDHLIFIKETVSFFQISPYSRLNECIFDKIENNNNNKNSENVLWSEMGKETTQERHKERKKET